MSVATWVMAKTYDASMREAEERCLGGWRSSLLGGLQGRVLEIGAGTGVNLPHYGERVHELVVTEPDPHMARKLRARMERGETLRADVRPWQAEQLPADAASFDAVVSTLVLCTVRCPEQTLRELLRVLRPGGKLVFIEHVAAEEGSRRHMWQRRIEPLWKHVAGNCHLTRCTETAIERAGFEVPEVKRESLRGALPWVRPSIRGVAFAP